MVLTVIARNVTLSMVHATRPLSIMKARHARYVMLPFYVLLAAAGWLAPVTLRQVKHYSVSMSSTFDVPPGDVWGLYSTRLSVACGSTGRFYGGLFVCPMWVGRSPSLGSQGNSFFG